MRIKLPAMAWFALLYGVTVILALATPPNPSSLHMLSISVPIYRILVFTILLPYGLIWGAAFYAYDQLARYSRTISATLEGRGFSHIVRGLKVLAWGLILETILSLVLSLISSVQPAFVPAQAVIGRYALLAVTLVAFVMVQNGTYILVESVHSRRSKIGIRALIILATIVGAFFLKLVSDNQSTQHNPYYLSYYPLLVTVLIPYICTWTIGILGTIELSMYARHVKGILYQRALQLVGGGLSIVILFSIASQYLTAVSARSTSFALGGLLIVIYVLLLVQAGGLVLVAFGAKQLKKIEDV